jgi:predicted signal transduction protein with EAL and GGDEF domain
VVNAGLTVCGARLLSISVGAAFCPENGDQTEGLLAEADRQMYMVKKTRKNSSPSAVQDLINLAASLEQPSLALTASRR